MARPLLAIALSCTLAIACTEAPALARASDPRSTVPRARSTATSARRAAPGPARPARAEGPIPVSASDVPPPGRRLSSNQVLRIASALPRMRALRASHPGSYDGAYLKGPARWQVSWFSKRGAEIGQAIVLDRTGRVLEQWTGFQVAWTMARGYPGAFGRHADALYVWLPLCVLFLAPFFEWRHPFRVLHFDLLVLLSFSVSLAFFNHADIGLSTPLAYPPLVYLLARMLWLARGGRRPPPGRWLTVPAPWLAVGLAFLVAFRIGLNVTDSNVIDVGYAGVIGAHRIVADQPLYGHWPQDNEHGDTYGPFNYEAYVPAQQLFGWSGRWDDLPAAHAAAIAFDLLAMILLFMLGRRARGPSLGIALAYAWAAYPFTLFALESNSNDALVGVLVLAMLMVASSPPARGALTALAGLTKLAPLALAPLFAAYDPPDGPPGDPLPPGRPRRRRAGLARFTLSFLLIGALTSVPAFAHDSLHTVWQRTVGYQADRESPFSIWGLYGGLGRVELVVQLIAVALALGLALWRARRDLVGLAAAAAAVLIAVQLGVSHWFYLYIPWFFGLTMLALLGHVSASRQGRARDRPGAASEPALSSRPAAV